MRHIIEQISLLENIAIGIAKQFGEKCEVIIHDYSLPFESSIVFIENGNVTGRKAGQSGTDIGLRVYKGERQSDGIYNYMTRTPQGKILRSSTIYIKDDDRKDIGSLCINFDITDLAMASKAIESFINTDKESQSEELTSDNEFNSTIFNKVDDLLTSLINDSVKHIGVPVAHMSREQKIEGIHYLEQRGAFLIKKAAQRVADIYDVSKFTIYNYLNEKVDKYD